MNNEFLTAEEMEILCPKCADKMRKNKIAKVRLSVVADVIEKQIINSAWESLPKGWTKESLKSFWNSLTGNKKHKITQCAKKMEGKVDNPYKFCGSLASKVQYKRGE